MHYDTSFEDDPILRQTSNWRVLACAALLAWCLLAVGGAHRTAAAREPDPMARIAAEFLPFVPFLPPRGEIGYLEKRGGNDDDTRIYYASQYALVPRVVLSRTGPEFLIVPRDTEVPGGDERLAGFVPVRMFPTGHRLFRRAP